MPDECPSCGASLDGAEYMMPWEDDDSELGYWICPNCKTKVEDWSIDDDWLSNCSQVELIMPASSAANIPGGDCV